MGGCGAGKSLALPPPSGALPPHAPNMPLPKSAASARILMVSSTITKARTFRGRFREVAEIAGCARLPPAHERFPASHALSERTGSRVTHGDASAEVAVHSAAPTPSDTAVHGMVGRW